MCVRGLLGEGTQDDTKGGNVGIRGELGVSLSFRPGYLPNNRFTTIATIDGDCAHRTQSMFTGHVSRWMFESVSFPGDTEEEPVTQLADSSVTRMGRGEQW